MLFEEYIEQSHKIIKITVTNKNTYSLMNEVVLRVILNLQDNEGIRFSLKEKSDWLVHQQIGNNFFILIPNNLKQNTFIYGHIIPRDIYEYEEVQQIFSTYQFNELFNHLEDSHGKQKYVSCQPNQFDGTDYKIISDVNGYDYDIDEKGRLIVQSKLKNSVSQNLDVLESESDPNYKNYVTTDNGQNQTEKGRFPLLSRFQDYQTDEAPMLNNFNPEWKTIQREDIQKFEVKIGKEGLSPLITNGVEINNGTALKQFPINVYLDYEYLPSSREYHQHFYGFEGDTGEKVACNEDDSNLESKTITVFESDNVHLLKGFDKEHYNYRIINWGDPYNNKDAMYVPHGREIKIDFSAEWNGLEADFKKNICHNYYAYTSNGINNYLKKKIPNLKKDQIYSLKFFMFLPSYIKYGEEDCSVQVETYEVEDLTNIDPESTDFLNTTTKDNPDIYKINNKFLKKDKSLLDEWIYHEIPFIASNNNSIKIIGPQYCEVGEEIFFADMVIQEMPNYTPTLKYSDRGIHIVDTDSDGNTHYTFKSISEEKDANSNPFLEEKQYIPSLRDLPTPFTDIVVSVKQDTDVVFDKMSQQVYYIYQGDTPDTDFYINSNASLAPPYFINDIKYEHDDLIVVRKSFDELWGNYYVYKITYNNANYDDDTLINGGDFIVHRKIFNNPNQYSELFTNIDYQYNEYNEINKVELTREDLIRNGQNALDFKFYKQEYEYEEDGVTIKSVSSCNEVTFDAEHLNYNYIEIVDNTTASLIMVEGDSPNTDLGFAKANVTNNCIFEEGAFYGFFSDYLEASYGPGNYITLYLTDRNGNPINEGTVDITLLKNKNDEEAEWVDGQTETFITKKVKNGVVKWGGVDFTNLKPNVRCEEDRCPCTLYEETNNNFNFSYGSHIYFLKITYKNECAYKNKEIYKRLVVGESNLAIKAYVNEEPNCPNDNSTNLKEKEIIGDDFPIKISAYIYDKRLGNVCEPIGDQGWCELSINDKKNQSSLVDLYREGSRCDFYLNQDDVKCNESNVIKIEYFKEKYNKPLCFTYFTLNVKSCEDLKHCVPMVIKTLKQGSVSIMESSLHCCYDDYIMHYIEIGNESEYSVKIERVITADNNVKEFNNDDWFNIDQTLANTDIKWSTLEDTTINNYKYTQLLKKNIPNKNIENYEVFTIQDIGEPFAPEDPSHRYKIKEGENYGENIPLIEGMKIINYRITTENMKDDDNKNINNKWRKCSKIFSVIKHSYGDYPEYDCNCIKGERANKILNS